ncbi:TrmO family methyltransferase domain-containing protein [Psychromonas ossibalaenae]|uniref:TrmO family methyltransferase domain-containing protein n=1 Tax=Psychromonas ossibalaenae TaxID=444922 RepID=UPI00037794DE|nr:TrmO family methyltransferase [Psychromonas ossibalaenae]
MSAELNFIGRIETPYTAVKDCPKNIQPDGPLCRLILNHEYIEGMQGLIFGQRILILYWLENTDRTAVVQSTRQGKAGTFALRSPHRPNPIGAAVLPIESLENGQITVRGLDCLNNTKLLDIKPAVYHES